MLCRRSFVGGIVNITPRFDAMFRTEFTAASGDRNVRERSQCKPVVVSGPSGGGKSTLLNLLFKDFPDCFAFSISHTTRQPRPGEQHGREYYFVPRDNMLKDIEAGKFLEHAEFGGNVYGTSLQAVEEVQATGKICILDVEIQGVRSIRKTSLNPRYIFIKPPSIEALEQRLRSRGTETEESLKKRLDHARQDMKAVEDEPSLFDHVVINDDLEVAYKEFVKILEEDLSAFCSK